MTKSYVKKTPQEKRQQIVEITEKLDAEIKSFVNSDKYKNWLKTMSKFHNYSFSNTILISLQRPDSSLVCGYRAWETNFNRHVKKGEKGIRILAPAPIKKTIETEIIDPDTHKPKIDENGNTLKEEKQIVIPKFHVVSVYDIAQTEGDELPTIGISELSGKVSGYKELIEAITAAAPVPVEYAPIDSGAKGYFSPSEQKIVINEGMSEVQTLKTLLHETAHAMIRDKAGVKVEGLEDVDTGNKTRKSKEVEAESIAYTCVEYINAMMSGNADKKDDGFEKIDVSDYSFAYIASWISSMEIKELKESMETIRKTASHIIGKIEENLKDRVIEKHMSIKDRLAEGEAKKIAQLKKQHKEKKQELVIA